MTVTPEQIESATFSTVKRNGYSKDQVDRYLRAIADEVRRLGQMVSQTSNSTTDLTAASNEMAAILADLHASIGERKRLAELEIADRLNAAEREAAAIISAASEQADVVRQQADRVLAEAEHQADGVRHQADRVLADAEHHAQLVRSDGEQRVREKCADTLREARTELQELLRRKHEILASLRTARDRIDDAEISLGEITPLDLDDSIVNQSLIDLREPKVSALPPPPPPLVHPAAATRDTIDPEASFFPADD